MKALTAKVKSNGSPNNDEKEPIDFFEVSNLGMISVREMLNSCVNTGLSPESFLKFIELSSNVDEALNKRQKAMKFLMNSYGVEKPTATATSVTWVFDKHEKKGEIIEKLNALNGQIIKLTPAKFIPPAEFFAFTSKSINGQAMPMDKVTFLSKLLMKK